MKPEISEIQFMFGHLRELEILGYDCPLFPSQSEENDLGYDVSIHDILFLQYKRADYLESPLSKQWGKFKKPYYRFKLHLDKKTKTYKQQNLLCRLAKQKGFGVYYCSPLFHRLNEYKDLYSSYKILNHSIFIDTKEIGEILDNKDHHVCYSKDTPVSAYLFSSPKKINGYTFEKISKDRENLNWNIEEIIILLKKYLEVEDFSHILDTNEYNTNKGYIRIICELLLKEYNILTYIKYT